MTYIVMTAAEKMPNSCWGQYRRVAVVELEPEFAGTPRMISERARGVRRLVKVWDRLNVGTTVACAYERALAEAEALAASLNGSTS